MFDFYILFVVLYGVEETDMKYFWLSVVMAIAFAVVIKVQEAVNPLSRLWYIWCFGFYFFCSMAVIAIGWIMITIVREKTADTSVRFDEKNVSDPWGPGGKPFWEE